MKKVRPRRRRWRWDNGGKMHGQRTGRVRVREWFVDVVGLGHPHIGCQGSSHTTRKGASFHGVLRESGKRSEQRGVV